MVRDFACAAILLMIAVLYYFAARALGETALSDSVGPAGLPVVYAWGLAIIALLLGISALARNLQRTSADRQPGRSDDVKAGVTWKVLRAAGALLIGVVYLGVVPSLGYLISVAIAIAAMAIYQGEQPSLRLALVACGGAAVLYGLFDFVLGVPLPAPWNG